MEDEHLLDDLFTASSEIGGLRLKFLVDSLREVINLSSAPQDVLKGVLPRCSSNFSSYNNHAVPRNINSSNNCHSVSGGIAPR